MADDENLLVRSPELNKPKKSRAAKASAAPGNVRDPHANSDERNWDPFTLPIRAALGEPVPTVSSELLDELVNCVW
jgi:hypothetical protein